MLNEFKAFIARGNVMDMAVGIIIGAAFTAIVTSLVDDLVNPLIGLVIGGGRFQRHQLRARRCAIYGRQFHQCGHQISDHRMGRVPAGQRREPCRQFGQGGRSAGRRRAKRPDQRRAAGRNPRRAESPLSPSCQAWARRLCAPCPDRAQVSATLPKRTIDMTRTYLPGVIAIGGRCRRLEYSCSIPVRKLADMGGPLPTRWPFWSMT